AALAPRHLGLRVVAARSFSRIHWQNLVNFGVAPLTFADEAEYDRLQPGDVLSFRSLHAALRGEGEVTATLADGRSVRLRHALSERQADILIAGGVINWVRQRRAD